MVSLDPRAFTFALQKISDGFLFERFAQDLLACIVGRDFRPAGGVKDGGVDGLEHCIEPEGQALTIYQISIEKKPASKIEKSLRALQKNRVECNRFVFVTNQEIKKQPALEEELSDKYGYSVICRDINWLRSQVAANENAIRVFHTFVESHLHEFARRPDDEFLVADFASDPRVYVFISQQWDEHRSTQDLEQVAVDSLILLALEGTDPDKNLLRSRDEIREKIISILPHASLIDQKIDQRLHALSQKPRRINHHKNENQYCLPYETRLQLGQKNLDDRALHEDFFDSASKRLKRHLDFESVTVNDPARLVPEVLKQCFLNQGLQFSEFLHTTDTTSTFERSLDEIIERVVEESQVKKKNKEKVSRALLATVREVLYQGDENEKAYLRRLSDTYMMMFLMQGDPAVAAYFAALSTKLELFVDNSILIPALSEFHLDERNRRFWNLLVSAKRAGVTLRINEVTLSELANHLNRVADLYTNEYHYQRDVYLDENAIRYVDEILLRSYFYQRMRGHRGTFHQYLDNFATPHSSTIEEELVEFLQSEFGIRYVDESSLGISVDSQDLDTLAFELEKVKGNAKRAENDAKTILSIFALRSKNNEKGKGNVFGYRTWWLSQDTKTYVTVERCFGNKYKPSCYLRPDFLYNFIALAPNVQQSKEVFDTLFPSLLGVSVSHHIDGTTVEAIRSSLKAHEDLSPVRKRAVLRTLTDRLKTDSKLKNLRKLKHYLDEELGRKV